MDHIQLNNYEPLKLIKCMIIEHLAGGIYIYKQRKMREVFTFEYAFIYFF